MCALLPGPGIAQSGRGRPRVARPAETTTSPPPPPVTVPAAAAVVKQEQTDGTSRFVLRNGMTVVVDEQHSAPIIAGALFIKMPAKQPADARSITGLSARILQNVLLRGAGLEAPQSKMRALGGWLDGSTSSDGSAYFFVAPASKFKEGLVIGSSLIRRPSIDPELFRREAALAANEQREPRFGTGLMVAPSSEAILAPPPLAAEDANALTRDQVLELYDATYRPENLVVVVAGDIVPYTALIQVQQLFGGFTAAPPAPPQQRVEAKTKTAAPAAQPTQTAEGQQAPAQPQIHAEEEKLSYANERTNVSQTVVKVMYRVPGLESPEWPAIEVLAAVMGRGRGSRLARALVDSQMVAARADARYFPSPESGLLEFEVWPVPDSRGPSTDHAESSLFRELDRIRHEIPTEAELVRAKSMLEQRFTNQNSSYLSRAIAMARAEASPAGLRAAVDYIGRVRAVRGEDVQRAAAKYLSLQTTSIRELEPATAPARTFDSERFSATLTVWAPEFSKPVAPSSVRPAGANQSMPPVAQGEERTKQQRAMESMEALSVKDFSTLNGPRAYVREDHSVPLVTLALLFQGGRIIEDANNAGITELMLRSMIYGTARRNYNQVTDELEQLGAKLEPIVEPDFFGFTLSVVSRNAERVVRILREIVEEPSFNDDDVKRAAVCQLGLIREERSSPILRARELLMDAMFAPHGYSSPLHGREEAVAKLTADELRAWHQQSVKRQLPLVFIVGDTDGSALVSGEIASGFRRRDLDRSLQVRVPQARPASEKIEQGGGGLSALALGFPGPRSTSVDRMAVALTCEALNGPGGLLNSELRDKQGVVVEAFSTNEVMFSVGAIWAGALTLPENEGRARAAMVSEFQQLARQGLSTEDLEGARAAALGSRLAALQFHTARAIEYARAAIYQQSAVDVDNYYERAAKVTADEVKRVATTYFKTPSYGIVHGRTVVSPPAKQN